MSFRARLEPLSSRTTTSAGGIMAKCGYCGTTILFGGARDGDVRYCNADCQQRGAVAAVAQHVPDQLVSEQVWKVHQGVCPRCGGRGPVDVHTSYRVWSALVLTS